MDKPQLHSSLCERFPEWSEQIGQLAQQDPEFEEACSDYEELELWLAAHAHEACSPESTYALNRLLLAELEVVDAAIESDKNGCWILYREAAPRQTSHLKDQMNTFMNRT